MSISVSFYPLFSSSPSSTTSTHGPIFVVQAHFLSKIHLCCGLSTCISAPKEELEFCNMALKKALFQEFVCIVRHVDAVSILEQSVASLE